MLIKITKSIFFNLSKRKTTILTIINQPRTLYANNNFFTNFYNFNSFALLKQLVIEQKEFLAMHAKFNTCKIEILLNTPKTFLG